MSDETPTTLYSLKQGIRAEIRERSQELLEETYPEDTIAEIVDSWVPIYTFDLLQVAAKNPNMAVLEPELGPAFDGTPTPVNIIAANIYEALSAVAFDEWTAIREEATR